MTIKELLEKYLIEEVEDIEPFYVPTYRGKEVTIEGLFPVRKKQINISKLIELLSKFVKVEDIIEEETNKKEV